MEEKMNSFQEIVQKEEVLKVEEVEEDEVALPGFRFHPTDEELVGFYLRRQVEKKKPLPVDIIKQIDIYKYDPWDLPNLSSIGETEWYFFCLRGRKYRNSIRPNRVTGSGFWKATGIDRPICSGNSSGDCIGLKKSLVYYRGSAGKGIKTDWMMHEFRLPTCTKPTNKSPPNLNEAESWTICRIFKRNVTLKKGTKQLSLNCDGETSRQKLADSSSKSTSIESDGGEEHRYFQGVSSFHNDESYMKSYGESSAQLYLNGQWNSSSIATNNVSLEANFVDLNEKEILREGNWDEIGRMVEVMMDPVSTTYDCTYY